MVPRFTDFYIPVLQVMSNVEPIEINKLTDDVADYINLSEEDKKETTGSGINLKYRSNISWAVTDLSQGGFIERVKRGYYVITIKGLELLEENPKQIDRDYLAKRSISFQNFLERKGTRKKNSQESDISDSQKDRIIEEIDKPNNKNESSATLDELYKAVQTLRSAKISTVELERKISEIEADIVFKELSESLSNLIPNTLTSIKSNISISLDYFPGEFIKMSIGNKQRTFSIESKIQRASKKTKSIKSPESDSVQKAKSNQPEKESTKKETNQLQKQSEEIKTKKSSGVWLQPYSYRTILIGGDTDPFEDLFTSYGGVKLKNTQGGWEWMFMRNKEEGLRKDLQGFLIPAPQKKESELINTTKESNSKIENDSKSNAEKEASEDNIKRCFELFNTLRSFNFLGITGPHKAILLIAMFDGIRSGLYSDCKIIYNNELELLYNENWNKYVGGSPTLGAVYPYIHLGRESFFTHVLNKAISDYDKTWSRHKVGQYVKYAILDKRTFETVKNKKAYERIKDFLINRYCRTNSGESENLIENEEKALLQAHSLTSVGTGVEPVEGNSINLQDSFRSYLNEYENKYGRTYSKSTISVYLGALNSLYMINVVTPYQPSGNIFEIKDPETLLRIKDKVERDYNENVGSNLCKSALRLYFRYIQESYCNDH